jgi:two-component system, chemotaxis family, protein-glutamate methylesterase/glutaminase
VSKLPVLLIEDRLSIKKQFFDLFSRDENLILIGSAYSELMAKKMLQSFLPSLILCNEQFLHKDFIQVLAPFFAGGEISLVVYGKTADPSHFLDLIQKNTKVRFMKYLWLNSEEERSYRDFYLSLLDWIASQIGGKKTQNKNRAFTPAREVGASKVIAIGASAGGPRILNAILSRLSPDLDAGVLIVQHITEPFTEALADSLQKNSTLKLSIAKDKQPVLKGHVYIAPGGFHLEVGPVKPFCNEGQCVLTKDKLVWNLRPAVDKMMLSLPAVYGKNIVGIILTGMGRDGAAGMQAIKASGGRTLAQDKETSMIFGMPKAVIETGCVDKVLPFTQIPAEAEDMIRVMPHEKMD